jgi:hypothetical protein
MIASKFTCEPATAEHRLDILEQEEIDRKIEEAKCLTGGHRIGNSTPASLLKPRHVGLTSAEEHAMWLKDISHWQGEYLAILSGLERVRAFVVDQGGALREHAKKLADMIAEHEAMMGEYEVLKSKHSRARRTHEQAAERHEDVMRRVRAVANAVREASCAPCTPEGKRCSVKER